MRIFYLANKISPNTVSPSHVFLSFLPIQKVIDFTYLLKGANKYKTRELDVSIQQYKHKIHSDVIQPINI